MEIKENIRGEKATDAKRFKAKEGGTKNTPVLITFDGSLLPARVFIGYLSGHIKDLLCCVSSARDLVIWRLPVGKQALC